MSEYDDVKKSYAYKMGLDCAKNGATQKNCRFSIFSSEEKMKAWERGLKDGKESTIKKLKGDENEKIK